MPLFAFIAAVSVIVNSPIYAQETTIPATADTLAGATDVREILPGDGATSRFVLFPPRLNFTPLKANLYEPRIGVFMFDDGATLRVDIGNSIDLVAWESGGTRVSAGIDFMACGFTTGAQGLRLQVDALDGFFGGNISVNKDLEGNLLNARLRILHHSAHFVDGHYLAETDSWINGDTPIAFTRDFGELVLAHVVANPSWTFRYYGGFSYATLVRPSRVRRFESLAGIEIVSQHIVGPLFDQPMNTYLAYNLSLAGSPAYVATHQLQAGLKFGYWQGRGVTLYVSYYSGIHMFREYLGHHLATYGAGFTVDFY